MSLHIVERGAGAATPVVMLHGFGGDAASWLALQTAIGLNRRTLALDLPGHGKSRDHAGKPYDGMAAVVAETLDMAGVSRCHLVAHSMGGAVATTFALSAPERIASLTLAAPGGFGGLVNARLMRRFASATDAAELQAIVEQFFGTESPVPRLVGAHLAAERADPAITLTLTRILDQILDGAHQVPVPKARLGEVDYPVRLLWGEEDRVQTDDTIRNLPPTVALHRFPRAGHMVHVEATREVAAILRLQMEHD